MVILDVILVSYLVLVVVYLCSRPHRVVQPPRKMNAERDPVRLEQRLTAHPAHAASRPSADLTARNARIAQRVLARRGWQSLRTPPKGADGCTRVGSLPREVPTPPALAEQARNYFEVAAGAVPPADPESALRLP